MSKAQSAAHDAVAKAVAAGTLPPVDQVRCRYCTFQAAAYHHWSYLPEHRLDVVPLCDRCHSWVHAGKLPDPTTGMTATPQPARISPYDRGACPWPEPPPSPPAERRRRLAAFRATQRPGMALADLFREAERLLERS